MTDPFIKLKPCPFLSEGEEHYADVYPGGDGYYTWWRVECTCGATGPRGLGNSGACEAWNTRPLAAQMNEALRDLLMDCEDRGPTQASKNKAQAAIAAAEGAP